MINRMVKSICVLALAASTVGAILAAAAPTSQPAKILPQHQQVLLFFETYLIAADQVAADLHLSKELHQKLTARIEKGRADAEAMLAQAPIPSGNGPDAIQASAKLAQQVSQFTRGTVRDIKAILERDQYKGFDERAHITMEEVLALQVIKSDTDYVHRDVLAGVGLSDEQQKKMDALLKDNQAKMKQTLRQNVHRIDDGHSEYATTELAFVTRASFRAILTADQLKTWDAELLRRFGGGQ